MASSPSKTDDQEAPRKGEDLELTREQLEIFVAALEKVQRKRKIQLAGYLLSALILIVGMLAALAYVGSQPDRFVGWVFFIPVILVGLIFWIFGRWAKSG